MIKVLIISLFLLTLTNLQSTEGEFSQTSSNPRELQISKSSQARVPNAQTSKAKNTRVATAASPNNWDFLSRPNTAIKGSPNWISASNLQILPILQTYYFKTCFCSFCPGQGITLYISSTSWIFVYVNGNWVYSGPPNWAGFVTITIPASYLKCGCKNTLQVYGFNLGFPSPIAISYTFSQNCWESMNCKNLGITFYNLETCQCECVGSCSCNKPLVAYYPTCACQCPQSLFCQWPRYFNRRTCRCQCIPRACCTPWSYQNQNTCECNWGWPGPGGVLGGPDIATGAIPLN